MSAVKFDLHYQLEEIQARLYRDTGVKLTKKEVLEIIFRIGAEQYDLIVQEIRSRESSLDDETIQKVLSLAEDLGEGSENLSQQVDTVVYGGSPDDSGHR